MRAAPIALLFAVLSGFDAQAAGPPSAQQAAEPPASSLSEKQAARLLMTYVRSSAARRLPGLSIERFRPGAGPSASVWPHARYFYYFTVMWRGPPDGGSAVAGNFAVNNRNGDIFEAASCRTMTSLSFRRARQALIARRHRTRLEMHSLRMRPDC